MKSVKRKLHHMSFGPLWVQNRSNATQHKYLNNASADPSFHHRSFVLLSFPTYYCSMEHVTTIQRKTKVSAKEKYLWKASCDAEKEFSPFVNLSHSYFIALKIKRKKLHRIFSSFSMHFPLFFLSISVWSFSFRRWFFNGACSCVK